MEITETILENNLPERIKFGYESKMGYNEVEILFQELSPRTVHQVSNNYFHLKGFMKVFGWLAPGLFKKQTMKYMTAFKDYAENQ